MRARRADAIAAGLALGAVVLVTGIVGGAAVLAIFFGLAVMLELFRP